MRAAARIPSVEADIVQGRKASEFIGEVGNLLRDVLAPQGPRAGSFITHGAFASLLLFPVRMMLLGLALENLAKGLIVAKNPAAVKTQMTKDGPKLVYPWGARHLSVELLEEHVLDLRATEKEVVNILGEFVPWAGRFPAPRAAPKAELRWDTELEPVYWTLSRKLRLRLKLHIRAQQRTQLEQDQLSKLSTSEHDGVVVYEDVAAEDSPGIEVSCECGSFFRLSPRYLAAICLCGKLYHGRPMNIASGGMRMDLDIYPDVVPPDAPPDAPPA